MPIQAANTLNSDVQVFQYSSYIESEVKKQTKTKTKTKTLPSLFSDAQRKSHQMPEISF